MRLPLLRPRSLEIQRRCPQAAAIAMRVVPRPEAKERITAQDAGPIAAQVVGQAEGEEIVVVACEEAEPKAGVIDGESKKIIRLDREDKKQLRFLNDLHVLHQVS